MAFSRRAKEPLPEVETKVWVCTSEECQGWMRETFTFDLEPKCPLCHSEMKQEIYVLPDLKV